MSYNDPISDLITRIRNAQARRHKVVPCWDSKLARHTLDVLQGEGYIRSYKVRELRPNVSMLDVELKYYEGQPAIRMIKRVSRPGRRVYTSIRALQPCDSGLGVAVLSTSKGVLSDAQARERAVGGEHMMDVS